MSAWWKRAWEWTRRDLSHHLADALDADDAQTVGQSQVDVYAALDRQLRLQRHCTNGREWPEHDEYDLQCGCRNCHDVDVSEMDDDVVERLFLGLVERERAS